jgi:phosphate starvation-inducible protein PhoH and related proteins
MSRSKKAKGFKYNNEPVVQLDNYITKKKRVDMIPRNINQEEYVELLLDPSKLMVFAVGPAGTGKTMLAVLAAIKAYKEGSIQRIVLTRPAVGVDDEKHGFLPGDLNQKMEPWTKPLFDVINEYYTPKDVANMIENDIIEIAPLAMMRGRTFKNCFIIADEMQNATPNQMKMILTRLGENSEMVITGDVNQTDRQAAQNGLLDFGKLLSRFGEAEYIDSVEFNRDDIERHPAVKEVLDIYGED